MFALPPRIKAMARVIGDNAMLYKDTTQWLRNQTFIGLFILLLGLAWGASVIVGVMPIPAGDGGPAVFWFLVAMLALYIIILAFQGYSLTAREFTTRTFELFELSGMSLERMVLGKLISMLVHFLFGYFCVVPFMFFAFLLGGLDFFDIVGTSFWLLVAAPPLFLFALWLGVSTRVKVFSGAGRVALIVVFLIMAGYGFLILIFGVFGGTGLSSLNPGGFILSLVSLDADTWIAAGIFTLFYSQSILFVFYLACHSLAPSTDSRELPIKLLVYTLTFSLLMWLGLTASGGSFDQDVFNFALIALTLVLALVGLLLFYQRPYPPIMARQRALASRLLRGVHFLFAPGAWGTLRLFVLLWATLAVFTALLGPFVISASGRANAFERFFQSVSIPLQLPWFFFVPAILFLAVPGLRRSPVRMRIVVVLWWMLAGLMVGVMFAILYNTRGMRGFADIMQVVAVFVSPASTMVVGWDNNTVLGSLVTAVRAILGVIGLLGMGFYLSVLVRGRGRRAPAPPPQPVPVAEPDGLSAGPLDG